MSRPVVPVWSVTQMRALGWPINGRQKHHRPRPRPLVQRAIGQRLLWAHAEDRRDEYRRKHLKGIVPYLWIHVRATDRWFKETEVEDDDE